MVTSFYTWDSASAGIILFEDIYTGFTFPFSFLFHGLLANDYKVTAFLKGESLKGIIWPKKKKSKFQSDFTIVNQNRLIFNEN